MAGRAKLIDLDHPTWTYYRWYCQFHGRIAGEEIPEPSFCWHEHRHECELVLVQIIPILGAEPIRADVATREGGGLPT